MKHLFSLFYLIAILGNSNVLGAGCNFAITNSTTVGATRSFTVGQGPWGPRKYTWDFGDGTNIISYSTPTNSVYATHTYSLNGAYSMTISAQDSLGGGCLSYMIYNVSITGITPTCQAQFVYTTDTVNCKMQFTNQSSSATSYSWLFSNSSSSAVTNPSISIANQSVISVTLTAFNSGQQCGTNSATISIAQNKCYTTGLKNNKLDDGIMIREKDSEEIEIVLSESRFNTLTVMDSKGLIITTLRINTNLLSVKTSQFSPGIYYLLFNGPGGTVTKKILK
ncbi:MAG: PKD domain-containing protein [Bacteroidetes bacterium]|nr:PKD domain-containing protein [Bacteroidota bacterium]